MSQYILINRIKVQNANAIAGFTWGFPAITHFLGFSHNLSRKLIAANDFNNASLIGCAVIAHEHHVHTYRSSADYEFIQSRNPAFQHKEKPEYKVGTPPVIEEGKMNLTVSLLIEYEGNIGGNQVEGFTQWLMKNCLLQRLAGGTILNIKSIDLYNSDGNGLRTIKRKLLPGFILRDRSDYLKENDKAELLDTWLDFSTLKQKARPKSNLISQKLKKQAKNNSETETLAFNGLIESWQKHLETPYQEDSIPDELKQYFNKLEKNKANEKLLSQWKDYCQPNEKTDADWEYIAKPKTGYLVPIMTGYKAISEVYPNHEVGSTRDNETDVCFVESVHSIGEWQSVHRLKNEEQLKDCLWHYHYEKDWYLCKQNQTKQGVTSNNESNTENPDDELS